MFYETAKNDHGLPRCPFKAIVSPRPVGWVSTVSAKGEVNLAPYSFFNAVSDDPPIVMFSSDGYKDSISFVAESKEFVCNLATYDLRAGVTHDMWDLELYAKNLGNSRGITSLRSLAFDSVSNPYAASIIQPRTVGITLSMQY